jgi:hypothetical protein
MKKLYVHEYWYRSDINDSGWYYWKCRNTLTWKATKELFRVANSIMEKDINSYLEHIDTYIERK